MRFPHPGEVFQGKYELLDQLGRGGFAAVYRARDVEIGRQVAIKVLTPHDGGYETQHAARFLREARVVAQLKDPHTITMYDFGRTDEGLLFMVFEYVAGEDLAHRLAKTGPVPHTVAVHVLRQLAEALREAHGFGVLHRDLKPANILVYEYQDDPWRVKLLDFGIAKPGIGKNDDAYATLTQAGSVVGTPRYMAPEQLVGDPLTPASDIFSLGLLIYEMLVGVPAINGKDTRENLRLQLSDEALRFPPESQVPPNLVLLVERMLSRKVEGRLKSTEQVLAALADPSRLSRPQEPTTTHYEVGSRPASRPQPVRHDSGVVPPRHATQRGPSLAPAKGPPWLLIAGGTVLVVGIVIGGLVASRGKTDEVVAAPTIAKRENPLLVVAEPEARAPEPEPEPDIDFGLQSCARKVEPGVHTHTDPFSGRTWEVYVPAGYNEKKPLATVLMLHDRTRSGARMLQDTGMIRIADEHNLLLVAPNGSGYMLPWPPAEKQFLVDVTRDVESTYCVDKTRRFAIGHNLGGEAVENILCRLPMSAIATTAHRGTDVLPCPDGHRAPHIHLMGAKNVYAPIKGGVSCEVAMVMSLEDKNKLWRERNGCKGAGTTWLDERNGTCVTYDCELPYTVCELDGGRDWPGAAKRDLEFPKCVVPPPDFPIAATIWRFFEENGLTLEEVP